MKKNILHDLMALSIPLCGICFFFFRLFYPTSSLFMIPDFGLSDVLHLNLPLKMYLSSSLQQNEWPLWNPHMGTGFPILAEGQIGTFFLPNVILFRWLPLIPAYNLSFVIAYIISALGMYTFCRSISFSRYASSFCATIWTFGGFFSVHLNHLNLTQTASLLPLVFISFRYLLYRPSVISSTALSFLISQQLFAGYIPVVFLSLCGLSIYLVWHIASEEHTPWTVYLWVWVSVMQTIGISAIQLFPTYDLWLRSSRSEGLDFFSVTFFPYPLKHMLSFFSPYMFGSPADGTYPPYSDQWGIFWENTAYLGIIPLLLSVLGIWKGIFKHRWAWIWILCVTLLLIPGKFSPVYFVFSFFPFSLFRVPSRFLLLASYVLVILAGYGLMYISRRTKIHPILYLLIFTISLLDVYSFSYSYPPISQSSEWISEPETSQYIKKDPFLSQGRIYTIGGHIPWNKTFIPDGWKDISAYMHYRKDLQANQHLFFELSHIDAYTGGLLPKRFLTIKQLLLSDPPGTISTASSRLLSHQNVRSILSTLPLPYTDMAEVYAWKYPTPHVSTLYLYSPKRSLPRPYLSFSSVHASTRSEAYTHLSKSYESTPPVIVEDTSYVFTSPVGATGSASIIRETPTTIDLSINTSTQSLLVLSDSYDPHWVGYINGEKQPIIPVNINSRGVLVPKGTHHVSMEYIPRPFILGRYITWGTVTLSWIALSASLILQTSKIRKRSLF